MLNLSFKSNKLNWLISSKFFELLLSIDTYFEFLHRRLNFGIFTLSGKSILILSIKFNKILTKSH